MHIGYAVDRISREVDSPSRLSAELAFLGLVNLAVGRDQKYVRLWTTTSPMSFFLLRHKSDEIEVLKSSILSVLSYHSWNQVWIIAFYDVCGTQQYKLSEGYSQTALHVKVLSALKEHYDHTTRGGDYKPLAKFSDSTLCQLIAIMPRT